MTSKDTNFDGPRIPEILAPAGGRDQFFAALNAGADAVFLGLKNFNARARAENFTFDDLRELLPIAHRYGMQVLVTLNVLIKNSERADLLRTLSTLEDLGVDAIIVQDLGVARLCKRFFPNLRMHASTQLAVHNLDGVRAAMTLGFKRVVLARELTALEIKKIRAALPADSVELEAFCHGSLCYSYSGLCFFSGAEDARSGNRGECAYTCRKPYRILNEPGHGFLFSMKDLNTVEDLDLLVRSGVDTLKIEGRKKDAQYVSQVVRSYRAKLDEIYGRSTLRANAPATAVETTQKDHRSAEEAAHDLQLTFQRNSTSFFLKGRYHENVIDLDNPTHKGQFVGTVSSCQNGIISLTTECPLERFDGLRIDSKRDLYHAAPQHGSEAQTTISQVRAKYQNDVCHFSLRTMYHEGKLSPTVLAGSKIEIELPPEVPLPQEGDHVYRTRSAALRRSVEKLTRPPSDTRFRPVVEVDFEIQTKNTDTHLTVCVCVFKHGQQLLRKEKTFAALRPKNATASVKDDIFSLVETFGKIHFSCRNYSFAGDEHWFIPRSQLKDLKRDIELELPAAHQKFVEERLAVAIEHTARNLKKEKSFSWSDSLKGEIQPSSQLAIKLDRLEYLDTIGEFLATRSETTEKFRLSEIIFEPKRAFLKETSFVDVISKLKEFARYGGIQIRLALPTVLRAWDEPLLKRWTVEFFNAELRDIEIGNIGHLSLLEQWGVREKVSSLASDFTLYSLNADAADQLGSFGINTFTLSIEDDWNNMSDVLAQLPGGINPQVILYKDTPLFIAESCSLTALHNGCPTNAVCGYRTLEIQNDAGEVFYVAHESCKSIVYAKKAFSISQYRKQIENAGVHNFRIDFLTRAYEKDELARILKMVCSQTTVPETHTANFNRTLL